MEIDAFVAGFRPERKYIQRIIAEMHQDEKNTKMTQGVFAYSITLKQRSVTTPYAFAIAAKLARCARETSHANAVHAGRTRE